MDGNDFSSAVPNTIAVAGAAYAEPAGNGHHRERSINALLHRLPPTSISRSAIPADAATYSRSYDFAAYASRNEPAFY